MAVLMFSTNAPIDRMIPRGVIPEVPGAGAALDTADTAA